MSDFENWSIDRGLLNENVRGKIYRKCLYFAFEPILFPWKLWKTKGSKK